MISRLPLSVTLVALLLFGAATTFTTLAGLPAFNERLQEENIFGSQRIGAARNRYDRADYLNAAANSFMNARDLPPGLSLIDGKSGETSLEVAVARAERATALVARSISHAPADANTWYLLSRALALSGKAESARAALGQSWTLAPYSRQIGARRLAIGGLLFSDLIPEDPQSLPRRPTPVEHAALVRDLDTLRKLNPGEYQALFRQVSAALAD